MGEQVIDVRQSIGALRRYRLALVGAALLGAAAGVTYASSVQPTIYSSSSQVLLPQQDAGGQLVNRDPATEARVAGSDIVLGAAGAQLSPTMTAGQVGGLVSVSTPGDNIIEYTAHSEDPDLARAVAKAAAQAEIDYIQKGSSSTIANKQKRILERKQREQANYDQLSKERQSVATRIRGETGAQQLRDSTLRGTLATDMADSVSRLNEIDQELTDLAGENATAQLIQPASAATEPDEVTQNALYGLGGAGFALIVAALLVALLAGRDKRLRPRDAIADATGSTVVASVRSRVPHTVTGWTGLLTNYKPEATDAWALRQVLRRALETSSSDGPLDLTLLTLADDPGALAVAAQTASYAASTGLHTRIVPAQRQPSATALWAALRQSDGAELRRGLDVGEPGHGDLNVSLVVLDREAPTLGAPPPTDATLLVLSAGAATAEELARTAMAADDAGLRIDGVVVADPDDLDHTTGRITQQDRSEQLALPARLTGVTSIGFGTTHGRHGR